MTEPNKRVAILGTASSLAAGSGQTLNRDNLLVEQSEREISPEREAEVRRKFENLRKAQKAAAFMPDFPPYQNLEVPPGCRKDIIRIVNDYWVFLGKRYIVEFTFEIVFGSKNSREKKIRSMAKKMEAMMKLCSHTELAETPGFTVTEYTEPQPE